MKAIGKNSLSSFLYWSNLIGIVLFTLATGGILFAASSERVRNSGFLSLTLKMEVLELQYDASIFADYRIMLPALGVMLCMIIILLLSFQIFRELRWERIFSQKIETSLLRLSLAFLFLSLMKGVFMTAVGLLFNNYIGDLPDFMQISTQIFDGNILVISAILFIVYKIYQQTLIIVNEHNLTI